MEVTGVIKSILPVKNGVSIAGKEWCKLGFTLETDEKYNNLYYFEVFGNDDLPF